MFANGIFDGHTLLSDWFFLGAAVAFLALGVLAVLRSSGRPVGEPVGASTGLRAALPWLASAAVAVGLLVL